MWCGESHWGEESRQNGGGRKRERHLREAGTLEGKRIDRQATETSIAACAGDEKLYDCPESEIHFLFYFILLKLIKTGQ